MSDSIDKILNLIDNRCDKNIDKKAVNYIKQRVGTVVEYDNESRKAYIVFPQDEKQQVHTYYNKTAEYLEEGDQVKIFYTTNVDKGWIGLRLGEPNMSTGTGLEPITAITINSNIDYSITTNVGMERYVGIFEAT